VPPSDSGRPDQDTVPLPVGTSSAVGRRVGLVVQDRYRLVAVRGHGGVGEVYEADDLRTGRKVAVKTMLPWAQRSPEVVRRFEREARAGNALDHPNIVDVSDMGNLDDGSLFLVMELVRGVDVADLLEHGQLAPRRALAIARQTLTGLAYAHGRGFVHRDLKPANLMIVRAGDDEVVKILDLGLVKLIGEAAEELGGDKLTATGAIFGTPVYMSPEQALGRPLDARTDLYTMGVILFEMLTGKVPFRGTDPMATLRLHTSTPPPTMASRAPGAAWITPELEAVVARALAKQAADRFASADEMRAALEAAAPF